VARWTPFTEYTAGAQGVSPLGAIVSAIAAFTSAVAYVPANWLLSAQHSPTRLADTAATLASRGMSVAATRQGVRVAPMGDSTTAYTGSVSTATRPTISRRHTVARLRTASIGGQKFSGMLRCFQTDVLALNLDIVCIVAGTNDDGVERVTGSSLQAMYDAAFTVGVFVVTPTIPPGKTSRGHRSSPADRQCVDQGPRRNGPGSIPAAAAEEWQDKSESGFKSTSTSSRMGTRTPVASSLPDALSPMPRTLLT
jgi:hypothetical protein